jgi:hypothetical protein
MKFSNIIRNVILEQGRNEILLKSYTTPKKTDSKVKSIKADSTVHFSSKNKILEVSEKIKNQLYTKFSRDTTDSPEEIILNIDLFDKYKQGLPTQERDITRYSYDDLKSLVQSKQLNRTMGDIFTEFKKKESGIENNILKKYIKKFLEIQSELPKENQNILKYSFLNLVKLVDDSYSNLLLKKMVNKFSKENPNLTKDQIVYYIDSYGENFDLIPFNTKGIDKMSFSELEHLLDGLEGKKEFSKTNKEDFEDINLNYDKNGLKIFTPLTKDQCIRLRNGRSWCTSREGSGNLYYNYRLNNQKTLYYVIDEDKSFDDLNFATVILVSPNGEKSMADKSNSGRYAGSTNLPWSEIVSKVPKLEKLEYIFESKPLTQEEQQLIDKIRNVRVGDNPMESFDTHQEVEMWLEYNSPQLSDRQYTFLTPDLKKKYIALGMKLSTAMIESSEPEVIKYYISKKFEVLKQKNLNDLSGEDVTLLNTPILKKFKEEIKFKFMKDITKSQGSSVSVEYPRDSESKFIALYGFEEFFESLPENISDFSFTKVGGGDLTNFALKVPSTIGRFKNLHAIHLEDVVQELPKEIGNLENLVFLSLPKNRNLKSLPKEIANLPNLQIINLKGSNPNVQIPKEIENAVNDEDRNILFIQP